MKMDSARVLCNILKEIKSNVIVASSLLSVSGDESVSERFYSHLHSNSFRVRAEITADELLLSNPKIVNSIFSLTDLLLGKLSTIEKGADSTRSPCPDFEVEERSKLVKRIHESERKLEKIVTNCQTERTLRYVLLQEIDDRLSSICERERNALSVAKHCSSKAIEEWTRKNEKPIEDYQLNVELLKSKLLALCRENKLTEDQLVKCCCKVTNDIVVLETELETETKSYESSIHQLETECQDIDLTLQNVKEELAAVTIFYDRIIEEKRLKKEALRKIEAETLRREKSAILIQRWFRFYQFRKTFRRKKKPKRFIKSSNFGVNKNKGLKNQQDTSIKNPSKPVGSITKKADDELAKQKKKRINIEQRAENSSVTSKNRPIGAKINRKGNRDDSVSSMKPNVTPVSVANRSSQTDNRIPHSRLSKY